MTNTTEFPPLARSLFPDFASDLVTFRERAHKEWPELPRWTATVSRADIETQRNRGGFQIPKRTKTGERMKCVYDRLAPEPSIAYAKRNGWPFTIHVANLMAAEEVKP